MTPELPPPRASLTSSLILLLSFIATLYPIRRASRVQPAEAPTPPLAAPICVARADPMPRAWR